MSSNCQDTMPMTAYPHNPNDEVKYRNKNNFNTPPKTHSTPQEKQFLYKDNGTAEEKEHFISRPHVKLDPGWEALARTPADSNNAFHIQQKIEEMQANPPTDSFRIVFLIMVVHGIGILMPWNMFITAKSYFEDYKLNTNSSGDTEYQKNFIAYLGISSQIPNLIMSCVNTFAQCGGEPSPTRIVWSIMVIVAMFIVTVILAMVDSTGWPGIFFGVTMGTVVIINMATGIYQNSVYGQAAVLPMKYTNGVVFGNNLSGTLASVIAIISIAAAPSPRTSAIYYFVTAIVMLLIAFDAYFMLPLTKFYKHFQEIIRLKNSLKSDENRNKAPPYLKIFKKIWVQILCIWFVFFVSLALFPAIQSNIARKNFPISDTYWVPIFCFLNFNFFAMVGNLVSTWVRVPGPRWVWIPILIRGLILIPVFMLCNFRPEFRSFPAYLDNDYVYIVAAALMAFTSGYFSSLCMMYGPRLVEPEHAGTAGMMMALSLVVGIVTGVNFALALIYIIENIGNI